MSRWSSNAAREPGRRPAHRASIPNQLRGMPAVAKHHIRRIHRRITTVLMACITALTLSLIGPIQPPLALAAPPTPATQESATSTHQDGPKADAQADASHEPASVLPDLPRTLPPGYVMEAKERVRWIYPESASDTVTELQAATPEHWSTLAKALGQPLSDELDIRVAIDPTDMRRLVDGRSLPSYASGVALPRQGLILLSLTAPQTWHRPNMEALLVHELAHVALQRAIGDGDVPRWFTEGVAIHFAEERSLARIRTLWSGTLSGRLLPAEQLSSAFPSNHHEVDLAYAQSADLVRYMLDGADERRRFRALVGAMREGTPFAAAVEGAYGVSLAYLEREWRSELTRRFGRWPTALAGLTGLWALGAVLLLLGYLRARRRHRRTLARWEAEEAAEDAARATLQTTARGAPGTAAEAVVAQAASKAGIKLIPLSEARDGAPKGSPSGAERRIDEVFDRIEERRRAHAGVPTVEHEGRSYTLH